MKNILILASLLLTLSFNISTGESLTTEQIIKNVEANMSFSTFKYSAKLIINVGGAIRKKEFFGYGEGTTKSFMEFTSPARDKGSRFLIIDKNLWIYDPVEDKSIKLSGNMLKGSFMGSDFSYKDATENRKLTEKYKATLSGNENIDGRDCYAVALKAIVEDVTYPEEKIWIDKEWFVPMKEELFAKSGKLLKIMTFSDIRKTGNRYYAYKYTLRDNLRKDSQTDMVFQEVAFDAPIPQHVFTIKQLH